MISSVVSKVFPRENLGVYNGLGLAKWVFVLITIVTLARSLAHILLPDGGAQIIATIPVDTFSTNAANALIIIFGYWGLSQLIIGLLYVVVLVRYQSLIPLMFLFAFMEYLVRLIIAVVRPSIELTGTAPGEIGNYVAVPLMLIMFVLALWDRKKRSQPAKA